MKLFKNNKDGQLYVIHSIEQNKGRKITYIAMPYRHDGKPIVGCDMKDFSPAGDNKK
jgi:hypothetical protein